MLLLGAMPMAARADFRMSVDLVSDLIALEEIFAVRTRVLHGSPVEELVIGPIPIFTTTPLLPGVRVADFEGISEGDATVYLEALGPDGSVIAARSALVPLEDDFALTLTLTRPEATVSQTVVLLGDEDGSGDVSVGDRLRYVATISSRGAYVFDETPDDGIDLIAGSVEATPGVITAGNSIGDTRIRVEYSPPLAREEDAVVQFDAIVRPEINAQGVWRIRQERSDPTAPPFYDGFPIPTDDISLPGPRDPTFSAVFSPADELIAELEICLDQLATCEATPNADLDGDGDVDIVDATILRRTLMGLPVP
jgi:hypothetical protein